MMTNKELFNAKNNGKKIEKGMKIDVCGVGTFADVDKDGHDVTVVALQSPNGDIYTTISGTIAKSVGLLEAVIADEGTVTVLVNEAESNGGRSFYTLAIL